MIEAARLQVSVDADTSKAESGLKRMTGLFGDLASAPLRATKGIVDFTGKVGLAALGAGALGGAATGMVDALFGGNVAIENVTAQMNAFTKDGAKSEQILADIRAEAAKTPFAFNEMAAATAGLIPSANTAGVALMDLVRDAEILAAANPSQGLEGAAFALREAVSGDFTSVIERFNLPRSYINQLKEEGVPALEIVRRAMSEMGYDMSLVSNLSETASGRWSTLQDTLSTLRDTAMQPIFTMLSSSLAGLQNYLDANQERLNAFAVALGERLAEGVKTGASAVMSLLRFLAQFRPQLEAVAGFVTGAFAYAWTLARDSILTFIAALSGDWSNAEGIRPLHAAIGTIGLVIREQVIPAIVSLVGWFTGTALPAIQAFATQAAGFITGTLIPGFQQIAAAVIPQLQAFSSWFLTVGLPAVQGFVSQAIAFLTGQLIPAVQSIAATVLPVLQSVFGFINQHRETFLQIAAAVGIAVVAFQGIIAPVTAIIGAVTGAAAVIGGLTASFTAAGGGAAGLVAILGGPVTLAVAAVAGAVALMVVAWTQNWGDIQGKTQAAWDAIEPVLQSIADRFNAFVDLILPELSEAWANVQQAITAVVNTVGPIVMQVFGAIAGFLEDHRTEIIAIVEGAWTSIKAVVETVTAVVSNTIQGVLNLIQGDWSGAWQNAQAIVTAVVDGISGYLSGLPATVGGIFLDVATRALAELGNLLAQAPGKAGEILSGIVSALADLPSQVFTIVADVTVRALAELGSLAAQMPGKGAEILTGLVTGLLSIVPQIPQVLTGVRNAAIGFFADALSWLVSAGGDILRGLWNGMSGMKDWVVSQATGLAGSIKDSVVGAFKGVFGISSPSRVMADLVGAPIMQGVAVGISQAATGIGAVLHRAANDILNAAHPQMTLTGEQIATALLDGWKAGVTDFSAFAGHFNTEVAAALQQMRIEAEQNLILGQIAGKDTKVLEDTLNQILDLIHNFEGEIGTTLQEFVDGESIAGAVADQWASLLGNLDAILDGSLQGSLNEKLMALQQQMTFALAAGAPGEVIAQLQANMAAIEAELALATQAYWTAFEAGMVSGLDAIDLDGLASDVSAMLSGSLQASLEADLAKLNQVIAFGTAAGWSAELIAAYQSQADQLAAELAQVNEDMAIAGAEGLLTGDALAAYEDAMGIVTQIPIDQIAAILPQMADGGAALIDELVAAVAGGQASVEDVFGMLQGASDEAVSGMIATLQRLEEQLTVKLAEALIAGTDPTGIEANLAVIDQLLASLADRAVVTAETVVKAGKSMGVFAGDLGRALGELSAGTTGTSGNGGYTPPQGSGANKLGFLEVYGADGLNAGLKTVGNLAASQGVDSWKAYEQFVNDQIAKGYVEMVNGMEKFTQRYYTDVLGWIMGPNGVLYNTATMTQQQIDQVMVNLGKSAGKAFGDGIADGAREALQVNSPSQVMTDLGIQSAAGFLGGWDRSMHGWSIAPPSPVLLLPPTMGGNDAFGAGRHAPGISREDIDAIQEAVVRGMTEFAKRGGLKIDLDGKQIAQSTTMHQYREMRLGHNTALVR